MRMRFLYGHFFFVFDVVVVTFIRTDSLSFSLLIILIATFFPSTQCTPNLTRPVKFNRKETTIFNSISLMLNAKFILKENIGEVRGFTREDFPREILTKKNWNTLCTNSIIYYNALNRCQCESFGIYPIVVFEII